MMLNIKPPLILHLRGSSNMPLERILQLIFRFATQLLTWCQRPMFQESCVVAILCQTSEPHKPCTSEPIP
jgi:hypothetical protein